MAEEFSRHIARVVASQIAESSGFDACQESAIEILGDLLLRYLSTLCSSSHGYAELAGRSQSNLADVLLALEDLGVTAEDLHQHMQLQPTDVPFAHTLAPYPVHTQQALPPTFADRRETHPSHIPGFLPAFPDPHTYQHTPAYAGHQTDPHKQRQSMLEAKQKAEAALNKLHQRMSSKMSQPDTNPYLAPPAVEQLSMKLQELPAAAAAAAAAAAGAAAGAAGVPAANGALSNGEETAGAAGQAAAAAAAAASATDAARSNSHQHQQQQQLPPSSLPPQLLQQFPSLLQQQQQVSSGPDALLDEDALFEGIAVLKAFSSILPPEVLAEQQAKLRGGSAEEEQQQGRGKKRHKHEEGGAMGLIEGANGLLEDDDVIVEEGGAAMDVDPSDAAGSNADAGQGWLGWKQQALLLQQQQQQGEQQQPQQAGELLGPAGSLGPELLRFGVDPLAAGKSIALSLAGRQRPADAYAERGNSSKKPGGASVPAAGGSRQRKSKYDVDPATRQAEGILAASAEAMFATAVDGRLAEVFDMEDV